MGDDFAVRKVSHVAAVAIVVHLARRYLTSKRTNTDDGTETRAANDTSEVDAPSEVDETSEGPVYSWDLSPRQLS